MTNAAQPIDAPYPADLEAKGWSLDIDYEKVEQSDTWAVATAEQRPWLLMLWMVSWRQVPVASLPNNDRLIAARIGMPVEQFMSCKEVLLSGWQIAKDGRLYHRTLTQNVLRMANKRDKDRARVAAFRSKSQSVEASNADVAPCNALPTRESTVSSTPTPTPTPTAEQKPKRPPQAVSAFVPPDWVDPIAWGEYVAMRKKKRAAPTDYACQLVITELIKLRAEGHDPTTVLAQSTRNNWTDVYAPKPNGVRNAAGASTGKLSAVEQVQLAIDQRKRREADDEDRRIVAG